MKNHPFTRPTVVAAIELLAANLSQAKFDQVLVRLELDHEIPLGPGKSVTAKSALLASAVTRRSAHVITTLDGPMTIAEAAVRMAVQATLQDHEQAEQLRLLRGLALDGYVVSWNEGAREPMLRAALPGEVDLPACDDEVHSCSNSLDSRCRWDIWIRRSTPMPVVTGPPQTARSAASLRAWSAISPTTSNPS